jgi:hypothetical protein
MTTGIVVAASAALSAQSKTIPGDVVYDHGNRRGD